jgi:hypothetical protein
MFKLGLGLTQTKTSLDIDALLFCERSGARDVGRISEFVRGIKALGLWNSMVCWPLRSTQNAATNDIMFSLGGLGSFSGTMTNGPIRGADGMTFATSTSVGRNRSITVPWSTVGGYDLRANSSVIVVSDFGEIVGQGSSQDQFLFGGGATANNRYGGLNARSNNESPGTNIQGPSQIGIVNYAALANQALAANTWRMWTTQRENNEVANNNTQGNRLFRDTTQIANGSNAAQVGYEAITQQSEVLLIGNGRGNTSLAPIGNIAFTAVFSDWTVNVSTLRTLYKNTLGQGLTGFL